MSTTTTKKSKVKSKAALLIESPSASLRVFVAVACCDQKRLDPKHVYGTPVEEGVQ